MSVEDTNMMEQVIEQLRESMEAKTRAVIMGADAACVALRDLLREHEQAEWNAGSQVEAFRWTLKFALAEIGGRNEA